METGHRQLGPLTRAVNSGSGNRALDTRRVHPTNQCYIHRRWTTPNADLMDTSIARYLCYSSELFTFLDTSDTVTAHVMHSLRYNVGPTDSTHL